MSFVELHSLIDLFAVVKELKVLGICDPIFFYFQVREVLCLFACEEVLACEVVDNRLILLAKRAHLKSELRWRATGTVSLTQFFIFLVKLAKLVLWVSWVASLRFLPTLIDTAVARFLNRGWAVTVWAATSATYFSNLNLSLHGLYFANSNISLALRTTGILIKFQRVFKLRLYLISLYKLFPRIIVASRCVWLLICQQLHFTLIKISIWLELATLLKWLKTKLFIHFLFLTRLVWVFAFI